MGESSGVVPCSIPCQVTADDEVSLAHQFKFGFSTGCNADRLDTVLPRNSVIEPKERLMWLNSSSFFFLRNLE